MKILVTVDTEGDNLWQWNSGQEITTENALYLSEFQLLCEKYRCYPVYLTNYEMANSAKFVEFASEKAKEGLCEIGMHLHAWNSPPDYELTGQYHGNSYITEYPKQAIYEKHKFLKDLIVEKFGVEPISYRSGRWATNADLFDVLEELGFLIDCSVTPGINHNTPGITVAHANNYMGYPRKPYRLKNDLIEAPMTTLRKRTLAGKSMKRRVINLVKGQTLWLRPALQTVDEMFSLIDYEVRNDSEYVMFMIHSSELMPGGSPYCKTQQEVNVLLERLEKGFQYAKQWGEGVLLKDYYQSVRGKVENEGCL